MAEMALNTSNSLRNALLQTLNETYAPGFVSYDWYGCKYKVDQHNNVALSVNMDLVSSILSMIVWTNMQPYDQRGAYLRDRLGNEIQQLIWINHPGGTTATAVAKDVCELLGVGYRE